MKDYALDDTFETSGKWFLPEASDRAIPGILRYSPKGTELQLDGAFWKPQSVFAHTLQTYPVVHGITREGEAVSLFKVHQAGFNMGSGVEGIHVSERLGTSRLLMGDHVQEDSRYTKLRFRMPGLQYWLSRPVVERSIETDGATGQKTWQYRLPPLEDLTTRIPCVAANIEWEIVCHESNVLDPFSGIHVTTTGWITLCPDTPQPLDWYIHQMGTVNTLMGFLAGAPMFPDRIDGFDEAEREHLSILLTFGNRRCCTFSRQMDFFMPLPMVEIQLEALLQQWFEIYPLIAKPTALAESVFASGQEKLWLHLEFLAWMQALEGLQRALPSHVLPPIQPKGKIPTLRERLDALTSLLPLRLRAHILDEDTVPKSWIDTRHYYTHWIEDQRDGVLDNSGLYDANVRAKHLMVALYLTLAGVPLESFAAAYKGTSGMAQELLTRKAALAHQQDPNSGAGLIMAVHRASGAGQPQLGNQEISNPNPEDV
jgi:hypothetical protein